MCADYAFVCRAVSRAVAISRLQGADVCPFGILVRPVRFVHASRMLLDGEPPWCMKSCPSSATG